MILKKFAAAFRVLRSKQSLSAGGDEISLSPGVRFRLSFAEELNRDNKNILLSPVRYEKFVSMMNESEKKRDVCLKSWIQVTIALVAVLFGANFTIPLLNVELRSIPAILEISTSLSILAFFMLIAAFQTNLAYAAIVSIYSQSLTKYTEIDPDFVMASDVHYDFFLKIARHKMNIFGGDYFESGYGFRFASTILSLLMRSVVMTIFLLYYFILIYSVYTSVHGGIISVFSILYVIFIAISLVLSVCMIVFDMIDFRFRINMAARSELV